MIATPIANFLETDGTRSMKIMDVPKSLSTLFAFFLLAAYLLLPASGQQTQSSGKPREVDIEKTASGNLKIIPITHASVMLEWRGKEIYIDPWGQGDYSGLAKSDLILITDIHPDHMDLKGIAAVKDTDTIIIAPEAVAKTVPEAAGAPERREEKPDHGRYPDD